MVIVIDRVERMGDIGEPVYVAYGQSLPSAKRYCHMRSTSPYNSGVKKNLSDAFPVGCYITEGVYAYLSKYEIESARSKILGLVKESYSKPAFKIYPGHSSVCWYELVESAVIGPLPPIDMCEGVVCEPECVGTDRYATVCKDGTCVRGALIKADSTECGYVPPPVPKQQYIKFDIPWLDLLPGIPYEPGMWIPPGFKIMENK